MTEEITSEFIRNALSDVDINALRIALYQATGDESLAEMKVVQIPVRGGAYTLPSVAAEDQEVIEEKAHAFLMNAANRGPRDVAPDRAEERRLMEMLLGHELEAREFELGRGELAFEEFAREAKWSGEAPTDRLKEFNVLVVGAGASGIATSVKLSRLGIDHTILERLDDVSGTWHRHQYPEVRVDTNSLLYQFKFEKRYPWPEYFPTQGEVKKYMRHVAEKHGVLKHVHFDREVVSSDWNEETNKWHVRATNAAGHLTDYTANVVISAAGLFSTPKFPDIPGLLDTFKGKVLHTSDWDTELDWSDMNVGLLGNGSTGTQILPPLAAKAKHVTAFQRTPQWIISTPTLRHKTTPEIRWLMENMPFYWNWAGYVQFAGTAGVQPAHVFDPQWQANGGQISKRNDALRESLTDYIRTKVGHDEFLFENSVPTYAPLARRLVVDNGWYDSLNRDNVDLNVDGIKEFVEDGVITAAGEHIPLDLMVIAAGFDVSKYFYPTEYKGRDGVTFADLWAKDGARAHLGMTIPRFPNFYVIYGPNAQGRAGGFLQWLDVWTEYITALLVEQVEGGYNSLEVRHDVFDDYNERMDARTAGLIYEAEGGSGYFVNEHGRSGVQMPWDAHEYHAQVYPHRLSDYHAK